MHIAARYENGVFRPLEAVTIEEGTVVDIEVPDESGTATSRATAAMDAGFFGLWKDRTDLGDSVEYVNRLRRRPRG